MPRRPGEPNGSSRDDDDAAAFAEAVRGVNKLGGKTRVSALYPAPARPTVPRGGAARPAPAPGPTKKTNMIVERSGEVWTARADGVDRRVLRKLLTGQLPVEGRLDLHGLTRARAAQALERFLATSRASGRRCLLIIHGRGLHSGADGPTLPDLVHTELTEGKHAGSVLASGTATVDFGGTGASWVLLRR